MVEVGQQINLKTPVNVTIRGIVGMYCQEVAYPVRIAKLSPEEIERYRIEAANEEPAVA